MQALDIAFMVTIVVVFLPYLRWHVHSIHRSGTPQTRWIESVIVLGVLFVSVFARSYRILSVVDPAMFSQELNPLDSYYYAVTVFSTVGFGDIAPTAVSSRSVTMVQMALDIAFIAVLIRIMGGAAKKALQQLQPGAWLVSLEFEAPALRPHAALSAPDGRPVWLYQAPFHTTEPAAAV